MHRTVMALRNVLSTKMFQRMFHAKLHRPPISRGFVNASIKVIKYFGFRLLLLLLVNLVLAKLFGLSFIWCVVTKRTEQELTN